MIVPHRELSAEALTAVIEEYVTRDGTELSEVSDKSAAVLAQLDRGELILIYDPESESCNILPSDVMRDGT